MKRIISILFVSFCFAIATPCGFAQSGTITTYAGDGTFGFFGDNGPATSAQFAFPAGIAVDAAGNVYVSDTGNQRIRKITPDGVIRTIAGNGDQGFGGDGGVATDAQFNSPYGVAVDSAGNVFVADYGNARVRKISPDGLISTFAGNGTYGFSGDGGPATAAALSGPTGVAVDTAGNLFITDYDASRVRKVTPDGTIQTVAGNGTYGFNGNSGLATSLRLAAPWGIALDAFGNFYFADSDNARVCKVTPDGQLSTVASGGVLNLGPGVAVDASGNLYVTDWSSVLRKVISNGAINSFAGTGKYGFSGDGGPAVSANISNVLDVALDAAGNVYFVDSSNNRIRKVERRLRLDFNGGRDFNGDSKSDLLFRDTAGNVSAWLLNGYSVASDSTIANIWPGWTIAGVGDFNGDGKSDLLWRDSGGNVTTWHMDSKSRSNFADSIFLPTSWSVAGVADFNGDANSDILWRNSNGDVAIWLMNGHAIASASIIGNIWNGWTIAGAGDFNGDKKADILWRDIAGNVAIWQMDGFTVSGYGSIGKLGTSLAAFTFAGIADFDGDGAADILWRDTAGQVSLWLMNSYSVTAKWPVATIPLDWTIVGVGDFNGDIRADILWRDTAGNVAIWFMDGPNILTYSSVGNLSDRTAQ